MFGLPIPPHHVSFGSGALQIWQKLLALGGLTFSKTFTGTDVDAEFSLGSKTGTFTASRSSTTPATAIITQAGNALVFDGSTTDVDVAAGIDAMDGTPFTCDVLINVVSDGGSNGGRIFEAKTAGHTFFVNLESGNTVRLRAIMKFGGGTQSDAISAADSTGRFNMEEDHRVTMVWDEDGDDKTKFYIDGVLAGLSTDDAGIGTVDDFVGEAFTIGDVAAANRNFDGQMKSMKIWNRALSASEVAGANAGTPGIVNNWDFSDGSGSTLTDIVSGNNGTITAAEWLVNGTTYVQKTITDDTSRFTTGFYDSSGFTSAPGLLLEGASTNLVIRTDGTASGSGVWTGWLVASYVDFIDGTVTETQVSAVDSGLTNIAGANAQRLQYTGISTDSNEDIGFSSTTTAVGSISQNDVIAFSVWLRTQTTAVVGAEVKLAVKIRDSGGSALERFEGSALTVTTDWSRFEFSATAANANADRFIAHVLIDGIDEDDTVDVEIWGYQAEVASFPSSFIPTTSAALTRNEEILEYVTSSNRTSATESGIIKIRPVFANGVAGGDQFLMDVDTKSRNMRYTSGSNDFEIFPNETDTVGSTVADLVNASWTANSTLTLGYSVQSTGNPNVAGFHDGVADGTDDNDDFTAGTFGTNFQVGADNATALNYFGIVHSVAFYDRVLTAAEQAIVNTILS